MLINKVQVPTVVSLIPDAERTNETLYRMFEERIAPMDDHVRTRLDEYFGYVKDARKSDGDWFVWCHKGIMQVATKTAVGQRNIAYLIGVFKAWLTYGFGTYHSAELNKIKDLFQNTFGVEPSQACVDKLFSIVQEYGIVHAVTAILSSATVKSDDVSLQFAAQCENFCRETYSKLGGSYGAGTGNSQEEAKNAV